MSRRPHAVSIACRALRPLLIAAAVLGAGLGQPRAAELKVVSRPDLVPALRALAPQIEEFTDAALVVDPLVAGVQSRRLDRPYDVVIADEATVAALAKMGRVAPGTMACVGWTGLGLAIRTGMPVPDMASVDALRRTLLAAGSIAFSGDEVSGGQFRDVLRQLNIGDAVEAKLVDTGNMSAVDRVAEGGADFAVAVETEIVTATGVQAAGRLPAEVQHLMPIFVAVSSSALHPDAGKRLISLLGSLDGAKALHALDIDTFVSE